MTVSLSIELSDQDLDFFTHAAENAKKAAADKKPEDILTAAGKLLIEANKIKVPDFIAQRLTKLDAMIAMVSDQGWGLPDEALDAIAAKHPLGLGQADDLVGAYSYLASDAARWTTGSAIVVDGGYAAP